MSDQELAKLRAEFAAAEKEYAELHRGGAQPGSGAWERVTGRYNRARDTYNFALQERNIEQPKASSHVDQIPILRSYLTAVDEQDTLIEQALKANANFQVPSEQANTIANLFDRIRNEFPDLVPSFERSADPIGARSQLRDAPISPHNWPYAEFRIMPSPAGERQRDGHRILGVLGIIRAPTGTTGVRRLA